MQKGAAEEVHPCRAVVAVAAAAVVVVVVVVGVAGLRSLTPCRISSGRPPAAACDGWPSCPRVEPGAAAGGAAHCCTRKGTCPLSSSAPARAPGSDRSERGRCRSPAGRAADAVSWPPSGRLSARNS